MTAFRYFLSTVLVKKMNLVLLNKIKENSQLANITLLFNVNAN